ncbi:MAG: methyltransferase, TIGR04325 family [Vicinamibacteria bacterium]|nr:methyltransferase, TIGR04325 family [Vicinamibacteria bacterium]
MSDWLWLRGEFDSWPDARAASAGYDAPDILERVIAATREVARGAAAFERDGVAFRQPWSNPPLLRALRAALVTAPGPALVLDFGGALGSAYWQHRAALANLPAATWQVVEQPSYAAAGAREFQRPDLRFFSRLDEATRGGRPALVIASSVLQYLEHPWAALDGLLALGAPFVFLDRMPLSPDRSRLLVEQVPPSIGTASYPMWLLAEGPLLQACRREHEIVERFQTRLDAGQLETWRWGGVEIHNQGLLLRRTRPLG